jgi:cobyrinic acid a,c-diamide synthase
MTLQSIPRIVIAGTHSGCGKTTVARGLMQALRKRGLIVQPFKVGPDFIDPSHHTAICGRISRNLDPFMMGEEGVRDSFCTATEGADIAVIEGVMGMYDGLDGTDTASTAHVMRILGAKGVLVVDVRGMSRSAHALVAGFSGFDPAVALAGVIFNRVGSPRHRAMIEDHLAAPALGWIPRDPSLAVESRHLGLQMAFEIDPATPGLELVGESCDLEGILGAARSAPSCCIPALPRPGCPPEVRIGVAQDAAFCFYYPDNLDLLRAAGATLVPFSPCADPLPDADAYYFGGGYPELHARALADSPCRLMLRRAADAGVPVYGECGGLLYLSGSVTVDEREFPMAGILPGTACMTGGIQALGYTAGTWSDGPRIAVRGSTQRGHEFHYSAYDTDRDARFAVTLSRGRGIDGGRDGLFVHEAVGSYTHSYFSRRFAAAFVDAAREQRRQ